MQLLQLSNRKPLPVLLMVRTLGPGGSERQAAVVARFLDRNKFEPHVCCVVDSWGAGELRKCNIPVLRLPLTGFLNRSCINAFKILRTYVQEHRIGLIHTFDWPMNIFGVLAGRLIGVPVVLASQRSFRSLIPPKYRPVIRLSDRLAHGVVVNCEVVRRHVIGECRIPERKVHLCYNALDTDQFHPQLRCRPGELRDASTVIGVIGVLRPVKDVATLIEAFALVHPAFPGAHLVIVGNGEQRTLLEKRASTLRVAEYCLFLDATDDVLPWLRAIDVFVLPSLSEGLSNSLMEAMACGCCVIASRVGGNPELVRHGLTGLLFEAGSASKLAEQVRLLLGDDQLRESLARQAAISVAERFSPSRSVKRMEEIYEGAVDLSRFR